MQNQKRYWMRGGIAGLLISIIVLIATELATTCVGICPAFNSLFRDAVLIYGAFVVGGATLGVFLGWLCYGKIKNRRQSFAKSTLKPITNNL